MIITFFGFMILFALILIGFLIVYIAYFINKIYKFVIKGIKINLVNNEREYIIDRDEEDIY